MIKEVATNKIFGGWQRRFQHYSSVLNCDMVFSIYLPPNYDEQANKQKTPVLFWLSGLTCNDQNFVTKAGAQRYAAEYNIAIVAPDTSPRGESVPDDDAWDFAQGAGFYLNATQEPWSQHFQMYDYIVDELPSLIAENFSIYTNKIGIFGHSMGGHGAITIALKNPEKFTSVSAFSPICSPINCPWGKKAFTHYLGEDQSRWSHYDSCELITAATDRLPLLVDQGEEDEFLQEQLKPELLLQACNKYNHPLNLRRHQGYDHSYYFIASFIGDHIHHHAQALTKTS